MPAVIPLIGLAASAITTSTIVGLVVKLGVVIALGAVSSAMSRSKAKKASQNLLSSREGLNITFTDPIAPHQVIYGERRVRGVISFRHVTNGNKFLHLVITFSGHPVHEIGDIYFDDELVPLDGSGNATGRLAGLVLIKKGIGTTAGDADWLSTMIAQVPTHWTSAHKQTNCSKIYVRLEYNRDKFKGGVPNITAVIKGKEIFDPRDSTTKYTSNAALCIRDYVTDTRHGIGDSSTQLLDSTIITAANISEEQEVTALATNQVVADISDNYLSYITPSPSVDNIRYFNTGDVVTFTTTGTLPAPLATATNYYMIFNHAQANATPDRKFQIATTLQNAFDGVAINLTTIGTGVHTVSRDSEPRYLCNGSFEVDAAQQEILEFLLMSMGGFGNLFGGVWEFQAGAYTTPTYTLTEGDFVRPIELVALSSRSDLFNTVKGFHVLPIDFYSQKGYPRVDNATYLAEDGEQLSIDMNYPFTVSPTACQRIGKILLEKVRQQQLLKVVTHLKWWKLSVGSTVSVTNSRFGFSSKPFEVLNRKFTNIGTAKDPQLGIEFLLKETASAIFNWNSGEDTVGDLSPNTDLGDPFHLVVPGNLNLSSGDGSLFIGNDGTVISRILATWDAPVDQFIDKYDVQFKKSSETEWDESNIQHSTTTRIFLGPVLDGVNYDVRVRSTNILGAQSEWVTDFNHTVIGKLAPPSAPSTFNVSEEPDGTRLYEWTHPSPDPDVKSGGGYLIRWFLGSTSDWGAMTPLNTGPITDSPYASNQLAAGTYTLAIKSVDSSGNESATAIFINNVVLGDPRLSNALLQRNERSLNWPGAKVNCFTAYGNFIDGSSEMVINDLPDIINELQDRIDDILINKPSFLYVTPVIDLGLDVTFRPLVSVIGEGTFSFKAKTGTNADGSPVFATNLVLTGDMSSDTNWTDGDTGTGVSTIASGVMTLNGGATGVAQRSQAITTVVGKSYQFEVDLAVNNVTVRIDGLTTGSILAEIATPPVTKGRFSFIADHTTTTVVFKNPNNNNAQVDNVSLGEFSPLDTTIGRYLQIEVRSDKYLGDDLVLTGDMSSDTNWTDGDTGTGVSTISGGIMTLNGGASGVAKRYQTISGLTVGDRYEVQFDIGTNVVDLTVDGDTLGDGAHLPLTNYAVGTEHKVNFVAVESSATLVFSKTANANGTVDNVIMRKVTAINMTEMSTIIDSPGKVETFDDVNTASSTASWFESIAVGHFKIETKGGISTITQAQITAIQNGGSGFSMELISKSTTLTGGSLPAAEFKIYKNGTLTNATVDVLLRGARA